MNRLKVGLCAIVFLLLSAVYFAGSPKRFYSTLGGWFFYQQEKPGYWAYYDNPLTMESVRLIDPDCRRCGAISVPLRQAIDLHGATYFLSQHTAPQEPVFAFPEQGIFTFLADRPHLSRFDIAGFAWGHPAWTAELLNAVEDGRPRFVVAGRPPSSLARSIGRTQEILPEVGAYLTEHYRVLREYGTVDVLIRNDARTDGIASPQNQP
jgi:hypothetical protein